MVWVPQRAFASLWFPQREDTRGLSINPEEAFIQNPTQFQTSSFHTLRNKGLLLKPLGLW